MKLTQADNFSNLNTLEEVVRYLTQYSVALKGIINGNVEFADNLKVSIIDVTFPSANTEVRSSHSLGRAPTGYIMAKSSAAASVYDGSSDNTDTDIYLKASAGATIKLIVF